MFIKNMIYHISYLQNLKVSGILYTVLKRRNKVFLKIYVYIQYTNMNKSIVNIYQSQTLKLLTIFEA